MVYTKSEQEMGRSAFTKLTDEDEIIAIPIAHGEGRYVTRDKELLDKLIKNKQILFRYSTKDGKIEESFPTNPNGAIYNIAAICNKKGNVMAMMPHPERASFIRQLPDIAESKNNAAGNIAEIEKPAPARNIFNSMKKYVEEEIL